MTIVPDDFFERHFRELAFHTVEPNQWIAQLILDRYEFISSDTDRSDLITYTENFFRKLIPSREEWNDNYHIPVGSLKQYMDGSKLECMIGGGLFPRNPPKHLPFRVPGIVVSFRRCYPTPISKFVLDCCRRFSKNRPLQCGRQDEAIKDVMIQYELLKNRGMSK